MLRSEGESGTLKELKPPPTPAEVLCYMTGVVGTSGGQKEDAMARSGASQSRHDREVRTVAKSHERLGYDVKADVRGYPRPSTIAGYRPDVIATKGATRKIVEVETPDSVDSARDKAQQSAFQRAARRSRGTTFQRRIAK